MLDADGRWTINDYSRLEPFCSFLPGIAGPYGIPLWCFYVNRGQCISSFGVEDKDHAIMEFFPAHQAYQQTGRLGFRTFLKKGNRLFEPFSSLKTRRDMHIGMNDLSIEEAVEGLPLHIHVRYATLPGERLAALIRHVSLHNTGSETLNLAVLDGMAAIQPYGLNLFSMKEMTQTAMAWMQAEAMDSDVPLFRVRASMEDSSDVQQVDGVHFASAVTDAGRRLRFYADPRHIFGQDTSLGYPEHFAAEDTEAWTDEQECGSNILPCCMALARITLLPGETRSFYMLFGEAENPETAGKLCGKLLHPHILESKMQEAARLTEELTDRIRTETGHPVFDAYCRQTYLDNVLRGGLPIALPGGKTASIYSRKHGDPERDYNAFRVRAEYLSQGNGNFRDVSQNRRSDILFDPAVRTRNVCLFYSLLQPDGYNPLVIQPGVCRVPGIDGPVTPGTLLMRLEHESSSFAEALQRFADCMARAEEDPCPASFIEGYWSDHWTYNLDHIEAFLSVWPEQEEALLFSENSCTWYQSGKAVLPRAQRYVLTDRGIRQYRFLQDTGMQEGLLRDRQGCIVHASVMEKLLVLLALKLSTLDPDGLGIEMEGGKPGWYDALNGLPGLLGSSVAETLELVRMAHDVEKRYARFERPVAVLSEAARMIEAVSAVLQNPPASIPERWNQMNDVREAYRAAVRGPVCGQKTSLGISFLREFLRLVRTEADSAAERAFRSGRGLMPTYFSYEVVRWTKDDDGLHPAEFRRIDMPDFLEGQVRALRLPWDLSRKRSLAQAVRASKLFDEPLGMYKVNADLSSAGYEIGRAHAFTPGWLENESVWLHMEYKYLLELLRSGLHTEFCEAFRQCAVPFLREEVYGRSLLENSSFIASSINPDPVIRGKGFVSRLSGSTAEFLSIWQMMLLGSPLLAYSGHELRFSLSPLLPSWLTENREIIRATLFGQTAVRYHIEPGKTYLPGCYRAEDIRVCWTDGTESADFSDAARIRDGQALSIDLTLRLNR